ncbi:HNH endonuclease signature motif containing protein [Gordonia polyisoprenivorans]|uniref:HNH endonuclease signature motif containing protein n=1 Tax=Gordonia polyisoprenivorans TaxID=84595 RepID=UPI0023002195|nr:HNH endonuclease signature motif containing protein [Gordonia polyisoprenivorans]WCB37269.1 HNH endonuclease signature motif containing protein [Gordonia polyisoprenivorans]
MSTTLTFTDPEADAAAIAAMSRDELTETGPDLLREARKHEARAVLAAGALADRVYRERLAGESETGVWGSVIEHADKLARAEVSLQFKISRSKAGGWIALADLLKELPLIRAAYLNGELSTNRASIMARAAQRGADIDTDTDSDSVDTGDESCDNEEMSFEEIVLDYGSRATTDPVLSQQLDAALISMNPDSVTEEREDIADLVGHVTITPDVAGHSSLDAVVPAHYGVFLTTQINALIDERTCREDPRRVGSLRVIALGEITGVPGARLDRECGQNDCAKGGAARDESAETPADAADAAAWDDLMPEPVDADVPDIDDVEPSSAPETADEHDPVELVEPVAEPEIPDPTEPSTPPEVAVAFGRALVIPSAPVLTVLKDPDGVLVPRLQGYGPIDTDYATTLADVAKTIHHPESARTAGPLIPQISDRPQAPPADPTGHGGHTMPPPGALTYAPSATLRAEVLANDAWCRYPYCGMPSHLCDLDHWRPFNHTDPEAGGWTVLGDLIPLCRADHQRKHLAEWVPTLYTDRRVEWRNRRTGQVIVTYPR